MGGTVVDSAPRTGEGDTGRGGVGGGRGEVGGREDEAAGERGTRAVRHRRRAPSQRGDKPGSARGPHGPRGGRRADGAPGPDASRIATTQPGRKGRDDALPTGPRMPKTTQSGSTRGQGRAAAAGQGKAASDARVSKYKPAGKNQPPRRQHKQNRNARSTTAKGPPAGPQCTKKTLKHTIGDQAPRTREENTHDAY